MPAKTIIIKPGETFILPRDAVVTSIVLDGAIDVTSTCDNLPEPESMVCYKFTWALSNDETPSVALEHPDSHILSITIGGVEYPVNVDPHATYNGGGGGALGNQFVADTIQSFVPEALMKVDNVGTNIIGNRYEQAIHFKAPESLAKEMIMTFGGSGFENDLFLKAEPSEDCATEI